MRYPSITRPVSNLHQICWDSGSTGQQNDEQGLNGGGQGAEEASNEGEPQAPPGAEHGPAIPMTDVIWQPIQVAWVAGQLEVDAGHTVVWVLNRRDKQYSEGEQQYGCLTSHEKEQASHILHEAAAPAAAQHTNEPAE
ncbi:hypothetical protein JZ751_019561 [Albula glossodonta]|uniref:Uncharacterized protein n=1 Tax=Albula glossodonta TaxID=121402 RepID=A0A8T2MYW0_9TELE|nr:hypothetical protein JZ751_019561 [Albula glossodonta]